MITRGFRHTVDTGYASNAKPPAEHFHWLMPDQPAPPGAESQPQSKFFLARHRSRQQQIGNIGAYDDQQHNTCRHQAGERFHQDCLRAQMTCPHRHHHRIHAPVGAGYSAANRFASPLTSACA
jgi:hypothetical protein